MGNVEVVCTTAQNINLAFYQNAIPIIRELSIRNASGDELRQIAVRLSSEPPFVTPGVWRIDRIARRIDDRDTTGERHLALIAGESEPVRLGIRD